MSAYSIIPLGAVIPVFFDSFAGSTGASITISGLAITDIEIYKGTSMTQRSSDAGYVLLDTDGTDLDGITGIQGFSIDTGDNTDSGFYAAGSFYNVVVSAITVDSQTVNFVAHRFRLVAAENTAGVPVVDTVRISNTVQTARDIGASVLLSSGTGTGQLSITSGIAKVDVDTIKTNPVVNAGTVTFPTTATLSSTTNITAGTITTATNVTTVNGLANDVITAASIAANAIGASEIADGAIDAATFAAGAIDATAIANGAIDAATFATGAIDAAAVAADAGTEIATAVWASGTRTLTAGTNINGSTFTAIPWNAAWDAEVQSEVTDALLAALTESYRTNGATGSVAQLLYEILAHLGEVAISGTTKTILALDHATPAATFTLDNALTPAAITRAT